jgi:hypothetical protein
VPQISLGMDKLCSMQATVKNQNDFRSESKQTIDLKPIFLNDYILEEGQIFFLQNTDRQEPFATHLSWHVSLLIWDLSL